MAYPPPGPPSPPPQHPGPYGQQQHPGPYPPPQQPGPYGQPQQPGPYSPQPGPYMPQAGNPYANPYAGAAPGYPPNPAYAGSYVAKPPGIAGCVLKVIFGGLFFMACLSALHETAFEGIMAGVIAGVFVGLFGWMTAAGLWGLIKRTETPKVIKLAFPLGAALLGGLIGPPVSQAYWESEEADRFETLVAATQEDAASAADRWDSEYVDDVDPSFHRPEATDYQRWANAARAAESGDIPTLRDTLRQLERASGSSEPQTQAEAVASEALDAIYTEVQQGLAIPAAGEGAFAADEKLRDAFATVLHTMAHEADPVVYVAFTNEVDMTAPAEDLDKAMYEAEASEPEMKKAFPDGPPIIEAGDAFSDRFDTKRRDTLIAVLGESFGGVFEPDLLELAPLEGPREGKVVLEVHSKVVRQPGYYTLTTDVPGGVKYEGLLMALGVQWDVRLIDAEGKELYAQPPLMTDPATDVAVSRSEGSPTWSLYSIVMDSAYYNYGRRLTGMFGLTPPPERTSFSFQG